MSKLSIFLNSFEIFFSLKFWDILFFWDHVKILLIDQSDYVNILDYSAFQIAFFQLSAHPWKENLYSFFTDTLHCWACDVIRSFPLWAVIKRGKASSRPNRQPLLPQTKELVMYVLACWALGLFSKKGWKRADPPTPAFHVTVQTAV